MLDTNDAHRFPDTSDMPHQSGGVLFEGRVGTSTLTRAITKCCFEGSQDNAIYCQREPVCPGKG